MNSSDKIPLNPERADTLREALLDLAYDVSSYLRRSKRAAVRISAALLLAASLAACGPSASVIGVDQATVQPLTQEVRRGLPTQPGRYAVVPNSLGRDAQGVYHFAWRGQSDPTTVQNPASASLLRLAQGPTPEVEVPAQGDPTLYLPSDASIPLVNSEQEVRSGSYLTGGYYPYFWHPFYGGYRGAGYYDPPATSTTSTTAGSVDGSRYSVAPSKPADRVVGLSRAVSGRAGGSGAGVAATSKSGAPISAAASTDHGGAAAAKSSGFSAGKAGGGSSAGGSSSS